jgi:dTDP-4-dehydrorhamnose 3,5-epimerase
MAWNDPELKIDWENTDPPIVSPKDKLGTLLREAEVFA